MSNLNKKHCEIHRILGSKVEATDTFPFTIPGSDREFDLIPQEKGCPLCKHCPNLAADVSLERLNLLSYVADLVEQSSDAMVMRVLRNAFAQ